MYRGSCQKTSIGRLFLHYGISLATTSRSCERKNLAQALKLLDNLGAWWYNLFGDHSDDTSLACLLGVDCDCLVKVFNHCGWSYDYFVEGKNQQRFTQQGFDSFRTYNNLNLETDKNKKTYYIKVGSFGGAGKFSCKQQAKQGITKPRISSSRRRQLDMLVVDMVASVTSSTISKPSPVPPTTTTYVEAETAPQSSQPSSDPALTSLQSFIHDRLIVKWLAIDGKQDIPWNKNLTVSSIMEALDSLNSELRTMQSNKVAKLINSQPLPVVKEKYKVLGEFHIPLDESKIQALLRDLQLLKNDCPAHALFDVPSWNDSSQKLLSLLRIKNGATVDCNFIDAQKHAKEALLSWRRLKLSVTVKAHLLESHTTEQMIRFGGIGDFTEDFIKQAHQWGEI